LKKKNDDRADIFIRIRFEGDKWGITESMWNSGNR